jgi:hypothetical protein
MIIPKGKPKKNILSIPAAKRQEFNEKMIRFHESAQATDMLAFHSACQIRSKVRVRFP